MCRACEEEALYQAYLDHVAKKAAQPAAPGQSPRDPAVCEDVNERAQVGSTRRSKVVRKSVRKAGCKQ